MLSLLLTLPLPLPLSTIDFALEELAYPLVGGSGAGMIEKALLHDLDADGSIDAALLDGGELIAAFSLESMTSILSVKTSGGTAVTASDMAILPASGSGSVDRLVTVGSYGLNVLSWSGTSQTFVLDTTVGGSLVNATAVEVGDWDGDGQLDLFVLDAVGTTVMVLDEVATDVWVQLDTVTAPASIEALIPLDWSSATGCELALTTIYGLTVHAFGQSLPVFDRGSSHGAGQLVRVDTDLGRDGLAWLLGPVAPEVWYVAALDEPNGLADVTSITDGKPVRMAAGDLDNDGDDDLLFTLDASNELGRIELEWGGSEILMDFGADPTVGTLPLMGGGVNTTPPTIGDINGNGLNDIVVPVPSLGDVVLLCRKLDFISESSEPGFVGPTAVGSLDGGNGVVDIDLNLGGNAGAVSLEVTTWIEDLSTNIVDEVATSKCTTSISANQSTQALQLVIPSASLEDDTVRLHFVARELDASGAQVGESMIMAYTHNVSELDNMSPAAGWSGTRSVNFDVIDTGVNPDGAPVGGIKGTRRIFPFGDGKRPQTGGVPCETPSGSQ